MKVHRKQKYKQNISTIKLVSIKALAFIIYIFVTLKLSQSADLTVSVCIRVKLVHIIVIHKSKEEGKDQELVPSNTTPDLGQHMEK